MPAARRAAGAENTTGEAHPWPPFDLENHVTDACPTSPIFLLGPTASGKTALAEELARRLPCEIVCVDSALVYRGLDVGTAKPEPAARARVPHHLVDLCDPSEIYSAARFCADAARAIGEIQGRGRVPLLVGGTMFYFRALEHGLKALPGADPELRGALEARTRREGLQTLHDELRRLDAAAAARIHPHDAQRVQRALEVRLSAARRPGERRAPAPTRKPGAPEAPLVRGRIQRVGLDCAERACLHQRIARRFERMLAAGFCGEVARLLLRGDLDPALPSLRAVGYRQMRLYLYGRYGFEEMRLRAICATRQLAKRQLTWMRRMPRLDVYFSDRCDLSQIAARIEKKHRSRHG